jgi:outer membrane receptor protein involved in Fe transport
VRGARTGSSGYFVDGVRVLEASYVPGLSIENISAFTGGVPAMYGDLTSGAVMITTKTYFSGLRDKNIRQASALEAQRNAAAKKREKEDDEKRKKEIEEGR